MIQNETRTEPYLIAKVCNALDSILVKANLEPLHGKDKGNDTAKFYNHDLIGYSLPTMENCHRSRIFK